MKKRIRCIVDVNPSFFWNDPLVIRKFTVHQSHDNNRLIFFYNGIVVHETQGNICFSFFGQFF